MSSTTLDQRRAEILEHARALASRLGWSVLVFLAVGTLVCAWRPEYAVWSALAVAACTWQLRTPRSDQRPDDDDEQLGDQRPDDECPNWLAVIGASDDCPTEPLPVSVPEPLTARQLERLAGDRPGVERWSIDRATGLPVFWDGEQRASLEDLIAQHVEPHLEQAFAAGMEHALAADAQFESDDHAIDDPRNGR